MICETCGNELLFKGDSPICPECNKLKILPKETALSIVKRQVDWFNRAFYDVLKTFQKDRLIVWLLGEREKFSTAFFVDKPGIELDSFLAMNVLIKRVMKEGEVSAEKEADEQNTKELISLFSSFINVAERYHIIEEGFGFYIYKSDFDIEKMDMKTLMSNFRLVYTFEWQDILKSFSNKLVMRRSEGDKYFEKYKEEYEKIKDSPPRPEHLSTEETFSRLFPIFQTFLVSLTKNKLFAENFDMKKLKEYGLSPDRILEILKSLDQHDGLMNMSSRSNFMKIIKKVFRGHREQVIFKKLVFNQNNQRIFPIFIELGDNVFTSPYFIRLLCVYYYPIFYKTFFDNEIRKQGDVFEQEEVPSKFKSNGFKVHLSFKDKKNATLEIDGLAWKDDKLFVIECKVWDIKSYFEHRKIHLYRKRDLEGIVDGKAYTTKNGNIITKDKPSIQTKVDFVKNNLEKFCPDYKQIKEIQGIIIIKSQPPIKSYKNIKIIASDEIEGLS